MNYEKIVTLYDTAEHAEAARRSLESAGFAPGEISMINSKTLGLAAEKLGEPGLWHRLFGRDIQQYEATVYGRTVEAGGVVLTVRVPEADAARATSILNAHRAIDLTKRAEQSGLLTTAIRTGGEACHGTSGDGDDCSRRDHRAKKCSLWPRNKSTSASAWSRRGLLEFGVSSRKHRSKRK